MKSTMHKNLLRTIKKSIGRYIAIMAIIALGSGIFVGLLSSQTDMIATGRKYMDAHNMFDLRLISTYGWTDAQVKAVQQLAGVTGAEGGRMMDVLGKLEIRDKEDVYQLYSIPESINTPMLISGRMPRNAQECLVDDRMVTDSILGTTFQISSNNEEDTLDRLNYRTFTIVGRIRSPLFMDMSRGNSSLGDGSVASFLYLPEEAFDGDIYTDIYVTLDGPEKAYSDAYDDRMTAYADTLESPVTQLAQQRYESVKQEAEEKYQDGLSEYEQGSQELSDGEQELADAYLKLVEGQIELNETEEQLSQGRIDLNAAIAELAEQKSNLEAAETTLETEKTNAYAALDAAQAELDTKQAEIDKQLSEVLAGLEQVNAAISELDQAIIQLQTLIDMQPDGPTQEQQAAMTGLTAKKSELTEQKQNLDAAKTALEQGAAEIAMGAAALEVQRTEADTKFSAAEAELASGKEKLADAQTVLDSKSAELADGEQKLADAQAEIDEGFETFAQERPDAEKEIAEGREELAQAGRDLADARKKLDTMEPAKVYLLNRNTNMGYMALYSNSGIVEGVSRVFPAFFLLVAALVCITTMTRMVEEERTQIGTMKALGYGSGSIISKYLVYAGSAAVLGCGLGVFAGSIVFPEIIWKAYNIMMSLEPRLTILFNVPLCLIVVASYTAVILLVTWYTCRRSLQEVPAELIRPKAPTAGKKILLEYMPFWKRISFLNKVSLRNIFRYHQRLLMMLVGIGGCTALLMTGFGIGDSIKDIVDDQYENVTKYDIQVQFGEGRTPAQQKEFAESLADRTSVVEFAYQASMELTRNNITGNVYLLAGDEDIRSVFDLHRGKEPLNPPQVGEGLISVGIAEKMDIHTGDSVTVRARDMEEVTVTITGIFDNNIDNYLVISSDTLQNQWNELPSPQLAFVMAADGQEVHNVGAAISGQDDVTAVMITEDFANQVNSMLDAMDMIVVTVVICAGILAIIVIYNLTNINITERLREIATIKVLGFRAHESAAYVFKENLILTAMGSILGLGFGKLLLDFVMSQIKIDMIWFQSQIAPSSIILSVVITFLMACVVDFLLYFRLDRINMAEALKSVE